MTSVNSLVPLEFVSVSKHFGEQVALNRLSLSLDRGEILGFIGPNGAGKTTTIHLALGFLRPTSGQGSIFGVPFGKPKARRRVGFLPDSPAFFAQSTVGAVEMTARLQAIRDPDLREDVDDLLRKLELPLRKDARKLSRGMQQRLGLAQALIHDPDLLILDEPTSALDPTGVIEVRDILRTIRNAGKSVFFSSHQLSEVEQICDRVAFLRSGAILRQGSLAELTQDMTQIEIVFRKVDANVTQLRPFIDFLSKKQSSGTVTWLVRQAQQRPLIEAAWTAGGELISSAPVRRTLEELFLAWSVEGPGA
jgi:ABC-2 type transport system ATP-binding protein